MSDDYEEINIVDEDDIHSLFSGAADLDPQGFSDSLESGSEQTSPPAQQPGPPMPPDNPEPSPVFESVAADNQSGFQDINFVEHEYVEVEYSDPGDSGLDLHKPNRTDPDPFLSRLEKPAGGELVLLQEQVSGDNLIYMTIAKRQSEFYWRHNLALLVGFIVTILAGLQLGKTYFTETLLNPMVPTILAEKVSTDIIEPVAFVLGSLILLPIFWISYQAAKSFLGTLSRVSLFEIFYFTVAIFFGALTLILASRGDILVAWLSVLGYFIGKTILDMLTGARRG